MVTMNDDVIEPHMFRRIDLTNGNQLLFAPSSRIPEGHALIVSDDFENEGLTALDEVLEGDRSLMFIMNDIEAEGIVEKIMAGRIRPATQH